LTRNLLLILLFLLLSNDEPTSEENLEAKNAWDEHLKGKSISSDDAAKDKFMICRKVVFMASVRKHTNMEVFTTHVGVQ